MPVVIERRHVRWSQPAGEVTNFFDQTVGMRVADIVKEIVVVPGRVVSGGCGDEYVIPGPRV